MSYYKYLIIVWNDFRNHHPDPIIHSKNDDMKRFAIKTKKHLLFLLMITGAIAASAQDTREDKNAAKKEAIKTMINTQQYVFRAQSVQPLSAATRQLTSEYDLGITKEKITSYLPYFGRAYSAPINTSQGGIQFTSTSFEYTASDRKKGGWEVLIKPKDAPEVQQLNLTISEDGYATLNVTSTNRQPISFTGVIEAPKAKK
jgi:hypothetical protein